MLAMAKKRTPPDLSALTRGELEGVVLSLWERLEALESKVNKTSQNSSKPPSSDGLVKKTSSLREPSGKPPGGQAGHKGTTLKRVADPTDTVNHPLPQQCMRCHSALPLEQAEVAARRQIIDVPATVFGVIEHRTLAVTRRYSAAVTNRRGQCGSSRHWNRSWRMRSVMSWDTCIRHPPEPSQCDGAPDA